MKNDIPFSWFSSLTDVRAQPRQWSGLTDLIALVTTPHVSAVKDKSPLYSPALYNGTPRRSAVNVVGMSAVVLDFDNSEGTGNKARCISSPDTPDEIMEQLPGVLCAWHTTWSHKEEWPKFRLILPLDMPLQPRDYPLALQAVIQLLGNPPGVDPTCKDVSRAYFVPSCPDATTYRYGFQDGEPLTLEYLADLLNMPPFTPYVYTPGKPDKPVSQLSPSQTITPGRNNALKSICAAMLERGEDANSILAELLHHDQQNHTPPLFGDPSEQQYAGLPPELCALKFFSSVSISINQNRIQQGLTPELPRLDSAPPHADDVCLFTSAAELVGKKLHIEWIIKNRLEASTTGYTFGPAGGGKTFECLHRWLCVATGLPWQDNPVKQGLVLYCCGEGHAGVTRRMKAWMNHHGMEPGNLALFHVSNKTLDMQHGINLIIAEGQALQDLYGMPLTGIVVDTVARHLHGDENSTKDMNEFIRCLDMLRQAFPGAVAEGVHHSGHQSGRARGSSAFKGAADFEFEIAENVIKCHKMKDAERLPDREFKLVQVPTGDEDEDGSPVTSCIVEYGDEIKVVPKSSLKPTEQKAIKLLVELSAVQMLPDEFGRFGAYVGDWRDKWMEEEGRQRASQGAARVAWHAVLKSLREQKLVSEDDKTAHPLLNRHQDDINIIIMSNNIIKNTSVSCVS